MANLFKELFTGGSGAFMVLEVLKSNLLSNKPSSSDKKNSEVKLGGFLNHSENIGFAKALARLEEGHKKIIVDFVNGAFENNHGQQRRFRALIANLYAQEEERDGKKVRSSDGFLVYFASLENDEERLQVFKATGLDQGELDMIMQKTNQWLEAHEEEFSAFIKSAEAIEFRGYFGEIGHFIFRSIPKRLTSSLRRAPKRSSHKS